jgi:hypothetical protein
MPLGVGGPSVLEVGGDAGLAVADAPTREAGTAPSTVGGQMLGDPHVADRVGVGGSFSGADASPPHRRE